MSRYKVGAGSVCQAGIQSEFGTQVAPDILINMTSESLNVTVNKSDEGNLLASKTANQRDVTSVAVDGSISTVLRPEFADWAFEVALGIKSAGEPDQETGAVSNTYTLADPEDDLPVSTIVMSRGGIVKTYPDITVRTLTLSAAAQDYVKADFDLVGTRELNESEGEQLATLNFTLPSYRCTHAKLVYKSANDVNPLEISNWDSCQTNALDIESCTITFDNGIEDAPATYCSGLYANQPVKGLRSVTCQFSIPYSDDMDDFRDTFYINESAQNVSIILGFTTNNTDENIEIHIPNLSITSAEGSVGGTGIIDSSFSGEALTVGNIEPVTIYVNHAGTNL